MRKRNSKGLSNLELVCILGIALVVAAVAAVPLYRQVSNALAVDADHNNIRQAYSILQQCRIANTSPVDGSSLPDAGEPIVFYYLVGGLFAIEGSKYRPVPDRAYALSGTDGPRGHDCNLKSTGTLSPGLTDPETMDPGTMSFCGAHIKGNYIKLIYCPGGGRGRWLLALDGAA